MATPYSELGYRRREDRRDLPQAITFDLKGGLSLRNAVLSDAQLDQFLRREFESYDSSALDFDRLPIRFRCVATDLNTLSPVIFHDGPLPDAVRASLSIPGIFSPIFYRQHYLVDGAVVDNLPTDIARADLHSEVVIAVHLVDPPLAESDVNSILGVFERAYSAGTARNEKLSMSRADILIEAHTESFSTSAYAQGAQLVNAGYKAAEANRAALLRYQLSQLEWNAYKLSLVAKRRPRLGSLRQLVVLGGSASAQLAVKRDLAPDKGQEIDFSRIERHLDSIRATGAYSASFESTASAESESALDSAAPGDTGLLVKLNPSPEGNSLLLFGLDLTAETSNVTRTIFDFRLLNRNLGGYESELRTDVRVGFLTDASTAYYKPFSSTGWYIQPEVGILRQPVYLWADQQRQSERFEQLAGGGLDVGRTLGNSMQLNAHWTYQNLRWTLTSGVDSKPNLHGSAQTGTMRWTYDRALTGAVSPKSLRISLEAGSLFHAVDSKNAPLIRLKTSQTWSSTGLNVLGLGVDVNTYFRRNVADPFRYAIGGPLRLSSASIDEFRGTDNYLIRAGYMRRIKGFSSGPAQGLFLAGVYEAGETWSPDARAVLRQDLLGAIVVTTPVGVLTLGGAIGDADHRKAMVTIGKLF